MLHLPPASCALACSAHTRPLPSGDPDPTLRYRPKHQLRPQLVTAIVCEASHADAQQMPGRLLCLKDSYARHCTAAVTACTPSAGSKKGVPQSWVVQLSQTVLYPEGGGQPADHGTLTADDGTVAAVTDVQRLNSGAVVHTVSTPLVVGASVAVDVDWDRRFDHMQHHTGQHLLSAVAEILVGAKTLGWELHSRQRSDAAAAARPLVSVELDAQSLTAEQVGSIEARCNKEIQHARAVRVHTYDATHADEVASSPLFRGSLPPADKIKDGLRMLELETLDLNPCGGTHLRSLSEMQLLKVAGTSKVRGNVVLQFLAGSRALAVLSDMLLREARLNAALSCQPSEHEKAVLRLQSERRESAKALRAATGELATVLAKRLTSSMPPSRVVALHRSGADMAFLSAVASAVAEAEPGCTMLLTADDGLAREAGAGVPGSFLLQGPPEVVTAVGPAVAQTLGGKGGGRPGRMQGKGSALQRATEARQLIEEGVRNQGTRTG